MTVITETRLSCDYTECPYVSPSIDSEFDPNGDPYDLPAYWIGVLFTPTKYKYSSRPQKYYHFCSVEHLKLFIDAADELTPNPGDLRPEWGIK